MFYYCVTLHWQVQANWQFDIAQVPDLHRFHFLWSGEDHAGHSGSTKGVLVKTHLGISTLVTF